MPFSNYSNATFADTLVTSFSADSSRLLYIRHSTTSPRELVEVSVDGASGRTLIENVLAPSTARALVAPTHVWYPSRDGLFMIPAQVWIPPNLNRDGSNPAVVEIHGGPQDQTRPALLTYIQVLTARGYIVISPNFRGSIGYSREFFTANRLDLGGGELQDVEAAADFLVATGYASPKKIAAYGASHGGYLTLLAVGRSPQKWAAGIALYPIVDRLAAYDTDVPWLRMAESYLVGDPKTNAERWREQSPLTYAEYITAPVLMDAGANDPRAPPAQARMMQSAIRAHGGLAELKIYGDEGHGRATTDTYIDENTLVLQFLDQHLRQDW
jgi:dipeptidyl aminopeptidase/acylaminoacyl peptidase